MVLAKSTTYGTLRSSTLGFIFVKMWSTEGWILIIRIGYERDPMARENFFSRSTSLIIYFMLENIFKRKYYKITFINFLIDYL